MNRSAIPFLAAVLLVPALGACSAGDEPATATTAADGAAERIIARETANAVAPKGDKGIDLVVDGRSVHASTAMQTGFRDSGEGHMMLSLEATRIEGQEALDTKVVVHRLVPAEGKQALGSGDAAPYIELSGVPGHGETTLRSVSGEVDVASLTLTENKLPSAVDAAFSGRFVPADGGNGAAEAVEISGRMRFELTW